MNLIPADKSEVQPGALAPGEVIQEVMASEFGAKAVAPVVRALIGETFHYDFIDIGEHRHRIVSGRRRELCALLVDALYAGTIPSFIFYEHTYWRLPADYWGKAAGHLAFGAPDQAVIWTFDNVEPGYGVRDGIVGQPILLSRRGADRWAASVAHPTVLEAEPEVRSAPERRERRIAAKPGPKGWAPALEPLLDKHHDQLAGLSSRLMTDEVKRILRRMKTPAGQPLHRADAIDKLSDDTVRRQWGKHLDRLS